MGVFGEKAVARVNGVGTGDLRGTDDRWNVQVASRRGRRTDAHGFVGEPHVQRLRVDIGVNGDGADAHLTRGAEHADGDLAPVGDENLAKHPRSLQAFRTLNSLCPNSTGVAVSARHSTIVPANSASIS